MYKKYFVFPLVFLIPLFTHADNLKATTTIINFCTGGGYKCAPELSFATTTSTSSKKYILPKEGVRIKPSDANFSIFKEKLDWTPGRNVLIVSRKWQTACLYDANGNIVKAGTTTNKYICMQSATGKKDLPTELGLYNIQTKYKKYYASTFYSTTGDLKKGEKGAPMPYAMHIGRVIGKTQEGKVLYDFSDGTAIHEKQTINKYGSVSFVSHGCIAVEKGKSEYLQSVMSYGDFVQVINDYTPTNLDDAISLNK